MSVSNILSVIGGVKSGVPVEKAVPAEGYAIDFEKMLKKTMADGRTTEKHTVMNAVNDIQGLQELQHPLTQLELSIQFLSAIRDRVQGVVDKLAGMQL